MGKNIQKKNIKSGKDYHTKRKPRILFYDIETAPLVSYTWGIWEVDVIEVKEEWYMLTFAYKWLGEKKTHVVSLPQFGLYKKDPKNDRELVKKLWSLFDEADVIVAHNGLSFDNKKSNARFIQHNLPPPNPYKTIDTKLVAKRYFKFDSNKLDHLGQYFNLGRKMKHEGFSLWLGCMSGDKKAWNKMCLYNIQDVVLLEKIYLKMLPYMDNHPNTGLYLGEKHACPNCGSHMLQKRGVSHTRTSTSQRFQCNLCHAWSQSPLKGGQLR